MNAVVDSGLLGGLDLSETLSGFRATGQETCFHGRHINPQIYADLTGANWGFKRIRATRWLRCAA